MDSNVFGNSIQGLGSPNLNFHVDKLFLLFPCDPEVYFKGLETKVAQTLIPCNMWGQYTHCVFPTGI